MDKILLFDIDGTLVESSENIKPEMASILNSLKEKGYSLGVVGGGKLDKILQQFGKEFYFSHYFSECGSLYHINKLANGLLPIEVYKKDIRKHKLYNEINSLIKCALNYLSNVSYTITGHFIDLRSGLIYVSLIGLTANLEERAYFLDHDKKYSYRKELLNLLHNKAVELNIFDEISITEGGSVGIAIYPKEFDKIQVLDTITKDDYSEIHYFGDKYEKDGNDYNIIKDKRVIGHCVNSPNDTIEILKKILENS
jgi:phosphomannomutase